MSKTPTKGQRRTRSMARVEEDAMQTTPPKSARLADVGEQNQPETPSPSRLSYQMNALDAALDHYFSPKKKSPGRSPGRSTRRKLQFLSDNEEEEGEEDPNAEKEEKSKPQRRLKFGEDGAASISNFSAIENCLKNLDHHLPKNVQTECDKMRSQNFPRWLSLLKCRQFNILVHGLGSKRDLLREFCEFASQRANHLFRVDGLHQDMSVQILMEQIAQKCQLKTVRVRKMSLREWASELASEIGQKFAKKGTVLMILVVNNLDSPQLRSRPQQEALARLAVPSGPIRIVASVDHVNAALLWDQSLRDAFSWAYFPVSTLHCYGQEVLECGGSKVLGTNLKNNGRCRHTIQSLDMFWEATTTNLRKILEQLAIHAPLPSERNKRDPLGIPKFCTILKEEFATTSETALRQQLIEFRDHNIIQLDRDENIQLTLDRQLLCTFLDMKNN